jgi:hypothetical protein
MTITHLYGLRPLNELLAQANLTLTERCASVIDGFQLIAVTQGTKLFVHYGILCS